MSSFFSPLDLSARVVVSALGQGSRGPAFLSTPSTEAGNREEFAIMEMRHEDRISSQLLEKRVAQSILLSGNRQDCPAKPPGCPINPPLESEPEWGRHYERKLPAIKSHSWLVPMSMTDFVHLFVLCRCWTSSFSLFGFNAFLCLWNVPGSSRADGMTQRATACTLKLQIPGLTVFQCHPSWFSVMWKRNGVFLPLTIGKVIGFDL